MFLLTGNVVDDTAVEPRVSLITLGVTDLERSLRFYRDGLGLPTTWTPEKGVIFFQTTGVCLALYPLHELAKDALIDPLAHRGTWTGIALAHNVRIKEDVDRILTMAEAAGGKIQKPAQNAFWGGYSGYFTDPDGYLWEVAWGAFDFREDGSLRIP
jgi:catechol 2,3-dioxygenase-like lactoylglutathione lyase family enzyme